MRFLTIFHLFAIKSVKNTQSVLLTSDVNVPGRYVSNSFENHLNKQRTAGLHCDGPDVVANTAAF